MKMKNRISFEWKVRVFFSITLVFVLIMNAVCYVISLQRSVSFKGHERENIEVVNKIKPGETGCDDLEGGDVIPFPFSFRVTWIEGIIGVNGTPNISGFELRWWLTLFLGVRKRFESSFCWVVCGIQVAGKSLSAAYFLQKLCLKNWEFSPSNLTVVGAVSFLLRYLNWGTKILRVYTRP